MGFQYDGYDYPTVVKDALVTVYSGDQIVEQVQTDNNGFAEVTLGAGTYRVTIYHPSRELLDFNVTIPSADYPLKFWLANEPYKSAKTMATNSMNTLKANVSTGTLISENLNGESANVVNGTLVSDIMSETPTVSIAPDSWVIVVYKVCNDANLTQGTISPDEGTNNIATANKDLVAATKQFCLYQYMYIDGVQVQNNSSTMYELKDTAHTHSMKNIPKGTIHLLFAFFRSAYEVVVSGGTTENGTWEILEGQNKSFTNNLGSPPVCYYIYRQTPPYDIIGTVYATYQWYLDGSPVGYGQSGFTVTAQTKGTSHTLSCGWTCVGR